MSEVMSLALVVSHTWELWVFIFMASNHTMFPMLGNGLQLIGWDVWHLVTKMHNTAFSPCPIPGNWSFTCHAGMRNLFGCMWQTYSNHWTGDLSIWRSSC
jgi:hypothetical protein